MKKLTLEEMKNVRGGRPNEEIVCADVGDDYVCCSDGNNTCCGSYSDSTGDGDVCF